jgi:enamine deaminase RidA (YjgF/YER057c/UK114 family)
VPVIDRFNDVAGVSPGRGYSHAVTASGKLAFIAGQVAFDAEGNVVGPGDLALQTEQAMRNLHGVLRTVGADWQHVVRFTWYVLDAGAAQTVRDARDTFLRPALGDQHNPASTLVQVAALVNPALLVEVDAVVAIPE